MKIFSDYKWLSFICCNWSLSVLSSLLPVSDWPSCPATSLIVLWGFPFRILNKKKEKDGEQTSLWKLFTQLLSFVQHPWYSVVKVYLMFQETLMLKLQQEEKQYRREEWADKSKYVSNENWRDFQRKIFNNSPVHHYNTFQWLHQFVQSSNKFPYPNCVHWLERVHWHRYR